MTPTSSGPILVTGASTGIGRNIAEYLARRGHAVYATARKKDDLAALDAIENVSALEMDVRNSAAVTAAVQRLERDGNGLYGLVNNAGIGPIGYLHTFGDEELRNLFEVNVFGPQRVTNACLDLLMESHGRVVNISSQGGYLSMKLFGPYTMTKWALEAYTIALRGELEPHGVGVSAVQPGGIVSEIYETSRPAVQEYLGRAKPAFQEEARTILASTLSEAREFDPRQPESPSNRNPSSPEIVSVAVYDALFSENPRASYVVGTRWEGSRVVEGLLDRLVEANRAEELGYSAQQLTEILEKKLASAR